MSSERKGRMKYLRWFWIACEIFTMVAWSLESHARYVVHDWNACGAFALLALWMLGDSVHRALGEYIKHLEAEYARS